MGIGNDEQEADGVDAENESDDEEHVCDSPTCEIVGGTLFHCCADDCSRQYHLDCGNLDAEPDNGWLCPECQPADDQKEAEVEASASATKHCLNWKKFSGPPPKYSDGTSRQGVMWALAYYLLRKPQVQSIYGGWIRDWLVRGAEANDLDVSVADGGLEEVHRSIQSIAENYGCHVQLGGLREKGAARSCWVVPSDNRWAGRGIEIDLVTQANVDAASGGVMQSPGMDCSAGNVCMKYDHGTFTTQMELKQQHAAPRTLISLERTLELTRLKQFVMYYDPSSDRGRRRLRKYQRLKWKRNMQEKRADGRDWWK
jgi:hypothetical protein